MNPSVTHPARSDAWPDDLYITEQLQTRRETDADYPLQMDALRDLAGRMLDAPEEVLPRFVERAQEITQGVSAGLSILEETAGVFRWRCLKGLLAPFENATTPRNYSPCGVTLDENRPVLCRHPERFYSWVAEAGIAIPEVLLVPLHYAGAKPIGTLWIVSEREGHFHAGHAKAASELARFAGIALRIRETQQLLQNAVEQQETLTREMAHRVKNLFTIAQSLVGLTAKTTFSKDQMAETLNGRFYALARAHALVRKGFGGTSAAEAQDLRTLLVAIVEPHNTAETDRFTLTGPTIALGERALNGMALIFHELTTNAVKYGALTSDHGHIAINWMENNEGAVEIFWREDGGREIAEPPELNGFGSKLLRDAITRQFGGKLEKTWDRRGLRAQITIPLKNLSR